MRRLVPMLVRLFPRALVDFFFRAVLFVIPDDLKHARGVLSMWWSIGNLSKAGFMPRTVIDVGAFEGHWTERALALFNKARFFMIEAQAEKKPILDSVKARYAGRVDFDIVLLGAQKKKSVPFFSMETGSSIYEEATPLPRSLQRLPMTTMDELMKDRGFEGPFFLKLDVQGAELEVLKGARNTLRKTRVLLMEVSLLEYNRKAPLMAEVVSFMKSHDFLPYDICSAARRAADGALFQTDLLFVRSDDPLREPKGFL